MMDIAKKVGFVVLLAIIFVYLIFPFYWAINSSLKTEAQLQMTPATFIPRTPDTKKISFSLENYKLVFTNGEFLNGLWHSTIVAVSVTILALIVGSFSAFALGKLRFKGKTPSLYIILAMTMFPQVTVLAGLYAVKNSLGLKAVPSMILTYMLFTLPFTTWVLTSFFRSLPNELLQSAQVDGATPFQVFYKILLPLTAPALVTTGLLSFIAAWNEYLFALTFTAVEPSARTVPVAIAMFTGKFSHQVPYGQLMAAAVVVTIPLIVLVLIFQKRIVAGLTAGTVKG